MRNRVCFHLWCELTLALRCHSIVTVFFHEIHVLSVTVKPSSGDEEEAAIDKLFPKALEGFIMVLTKEGDLVYLSEDIQKHLGLSQVI